jgi:hypothetical protein
LQPQPIPAVQNSDDIIDNWLSTKTTLKFGGVGPGATDDIAKIVRATVGVPIQLVSGYKLDKNLVAKLKDILK